MPRHPSLAATAEGLSDAVYSALAARMREAPGPIYPLHVGDTWLEPLPAARAEAQRTADHPRLHNYAPVQGEPALLAAIRRRILARHGFDLDPACLQVVPGATTGLAIVVAALLDPGDELLLPSPFWPLIRGIATTRGCPAVEVPFFTRLDDPGFDAEAALERAVTPRTAALYVNSPHNPTGRVLPEPVVAAVARVARRHDLWVLADAAYEDLAYAAAAPPLWRRADLAERTIAVHTCSKSHALAGARVGWVHGPPAAMRAIRGVQTFNAYCAARPMQCSSGRRAPWRKATPGRRKRGGSTARPAPRRPPCSVSHRPRQGRSSSSMLRPSCNRASSSTTSSSAAWKPACSSPRGEPRAATTRPGRGSASPQFLPRISPAPWSG